MHVQADIPSSPKLPALLELQARPQWVCWRKEQRQDRFTKVPYNARTGKRAASDDSATWASYDQAVRALRTGHYLGLGYVFQQDYTGIDLDHCVKPDGSIEPWAQVYLDQLGSYAEYSPSGAGVHVLVRGTITSGLRRRMPQAPHPEAAIEMYCQRRYFTITGNHAHELRNEIGEELIADWVRESCAEQDTPLVRSGRIRGMESKKCRR